MPRPRKQKTINEMKAELEALQQQIEQKEFQDKVSALTASSEFKAVARQISRLGLSAEDIAGLFPAPGGAKPAPRAPRKKADVKTKAKARPKMKVKPKYRNPDNAKETWTGRGKQPRWVGAAIASGKALDDLLIK
ncbi:MAG: H-NS histone family protein [Gammaproteobacteria bacterium]|nr:H-NS histone family protein [Gammaproteobacteria bacterium]